MNTTTTTPNNPTASRKTILVVDDEAYIKHVVTLKLTNAGYDVICASDGEEGYEMACDRRPDLIITDFQMPYMTGLEMCRKLRADARTKAIPVLMLTARGYALDENELRAMNIVQALGKPFSPRELLSSVKGAIAA